MSTFCFLSTSRAPKMRTENELKYLTKQADSAEYKEVFSVVSRPAIYGKLFYTLFTAPREPAKTSTSVKRATNLTVK